MNKYLTILILLITSSCCKDSIEIARYYLTENEKEFIPYTENQKIKYKYSNGFDFYMNVIDVKTEFKRTKTEHCGENYVSFESKTAYLQSDIPDFNISISIKPKEYCTDIGIMINNSYLQKDVSVKADFDTLIIDNNKYFNVYQFENHIIDTTIINPYKVLYNKTDGIIQIIMTDDEKFTISK